MNAARQVISKRIVNSLGASIRTPVRNASTTAVHHGLPQQDKKLMNGIFTVASVATVSAVVYGASRSGNRMNSRYSKKNSGLDSSKWFAEGTEAGHY